MISCEHHLSVNWQSQNQAQDASFGKQHIQAFPHGYLHSERPDSQSNRPRALLQRYQDDLPW